jgi:CubicO group peptidase (beta-lactamase class C family)
MRLQYRGDLSLELVINEIVPEARVVNPWQQDNPVRLYHVLEHTAGFAA